MEHVLGDRERIGEPRQHLADDRSHHDRIPQPAGWRRTRRRRAGTPGLRHSRSRAVDSRRPATSTSRRSPVEWPSVSFTSFEAVEVQQRDRGRDAVVAQQRVEPFFHGTPVGEAGELVEMGELPQLLLRLLAGRHVLVHERDAAHGAVLAEQRCCRQADVDDFAVLAQPLNSTARMTSPLRAR